MKYDVFIAHPNEHKAAATALERALAGVGLRGFVDLQVPAGAAWQAMLQQVQEGCRATVVLWVEGLQPRPYLLHEVAVAIELHDDGHAVLPVWMEGTPARPARRLPPGLGGFQALDAKALGWDGVARGIARVLAGGAPVLPAQAGAAPVARRPRAPGEVVHEAEGLRFVFVPGGTFLMGRPDRPALGSVDATSTWDDEKPQHEVRLSAFALAATPVTQAAWEAVMGSNPSYFKGRPDSARRPVESVSWFDAVRFCNRLSEREGRAPAYAIGAGDTPEVRAVPGANGYRLPTEAQWEYACRAGSRGAFWSGDAEADLARVGWYDRNSGVETHPVGTKEPNPWGLYDVHGNVWEWCWDGYDSAWYADPAARGLDPTGPSRGSGRVMRGGSYGLTAGRCRAAIRNWDEPSHRNWNWGFRPALPVAAELGHDR